MPVIREIGPYQEEPNIKEIGPYQASQSIREIGPYDDSREIREIGPVRPEKKPRPAPSFMELQQGFGVLPAIGLKAVQGAATAIDKVFGDTEYEKEQQRRDTSGAMIEESTPANIALTVAGAKGLSMLTKTPFAPVREAIEAVTQIPMPWKGKKSVAQREITQNLPSSTISANMVDPKIESLMEESIQYKNKDDFIKKYYTETSYDFRPGATRIATTGETGLYHGAGVTNLKSILSDGKIRTNISDLDNVGENVISVSGNRSVSGSYGVVFELDDTLPKRVAPYEAIKGDNVFDGFEYRLDNDVPLSSVKNVTIPLNRSEGLKTKIMWDYRGKPEYISATDLAELFRAKGIKVFYDDGSTFSEKHLGDIWDKARGLNRRPSASIQPSTPTSKIAQVVDSMYDASEKEVKDLHKVNIPAILRKAKTTLVDASGNVKKDLKKLGPLGEDAAIRHDLARGASAITDMELDKYRRSIYEGLSHDDERQLNRMIASRRTVAIGQYKDVANTKGLTPEHHAEYLKSLAEADPQRFKALNDRADKYFGVMQEQLGKMKQAGLLDDASYQALLAKGDYSPRRFIQYIDPEQNYTFGGTKLTVPSSGIKALKEGSEQAMENNSRLLMAEVVSRTNARIMKNRANQELFKLAQELPENGIVNMTAPKRKLFYNGKSLDDNAIIVDAYIDGERKQYSAGKIAQMVDNVRNAEDQAVLKRISKQYQKYKWGMSEPSPRAGHEIISVMVDGKPKYMEMPSDIAKEWVLSDPQISKQLSSTIGWLSGSKILKPMATGLNPEFAVTNFARDLAHIFLTTDEYSSFLPKAMGQQAVDLVSTAKDAVLRKGDYLKYVQQGGGMEFLTHQGRPGVAGAAIDKLYGVMGYLGETTEIWSRLALRKRALKNASKEGLEPARAEMRATYAARNYLDFSQGGSFVKAADSAIPYLNAAVQGTRGVFRYAADHPGKFTYKVGQIGTMAAGLYYANRITNPDAWEQVPDREKASNFIFTTPLYYYDKNGDKRYYYFKVAKDQSQRIFASIFENIAAAAMGDTFKTNQLAMAFEDGLPIVPTGVLPPSIEAMLGYASNKNFWRNEDIWRGRKGIEPSQEYNRYTPEAYVKLGEATGMSPERTKYALEQVFTSGNIWTSLTGGAMSAMLGELPKDMRDKTMQEIIGQAPFIRKALRSTDPFTPYQQESEEIKRGRATRRSVMRREFDAIADDYARDRISKEDAVEFINTQPREQRRYLLRQLNEKKSLTGIPDGRWWRDLQYQDAGTRAEMFHRRYERASEEEKERLDRQLYKLKSIRSKEFNAELRRLRNENQ